MRKTKIIVTLGPATLAPEMIHQLIQAGTNVFRLNMSHATRDWVRQVCPQIRSLAAELHRNVGIIMDTQGPAIRTGDLPSSIHLKTGDTFTFTVRGEKSEEVNSVDVNYDDLITDIKVGDVVLVDNGVIRMQVLSKEGNKIHCRVLTPGEMGSRRHINLPGVRVNLPALTEKDLADIEVGIECAVDFIALSFVREANDIAILRDLLKSRDSRIRIIAKIEDQSAVRNLDEIIDASDAVMVARGDLGIEMPYEEMPIIQRRIVKHCLQKVKPVIVATHLLESMISNPLPTRAEITDSANAVYEQADAIMLSGETTIGKYPVECVTVLDRIAQRTERSGNAGYTAQIAFHTDRERVVASAVYLANESRADGICVFTRRGRLAGMTAGLRPSFSPIFAFTEDQTMMRQFSLHYGMIPFHLDFSADFSANIVTAEKMLLDRHWVKRGARLVIVSDIVIGQQMNHAVHLRVVT
jgi:pyruvate kinase